jgi:hypothetical protein
MSTTPVTVGTDSFRVTSNTEKAEDMIAALEPPDPKANKPRILSTDGETVEEKDPVSEAASTLGKKGGKATADARKAAEKESAKESPDKAAKPDKAAETKKAGEAEGDTDKEEAKSKKGDPRHDPEARIAVLAREKREAQDRADRAERDLENERRSRTQPARDERPAPVQERREAKPADDPEPQEAEFDNYADYVKAAGRHAARTEFRERERQSQEREREVQRDRFVHKSLETFSERLTKRAEADDTFIDRTKDFATSLQPSFMRAQGAPLEGRHVAADCVIRSERAPELIEHFTENPDEFQRIASLRTVPDIRVAVANLEGYLRARSERPAAATADTSARRETSRAGTPVRSVAGTPNTEAGETDDEPLSVRARRFGERELAASRR